jgi:hydroxypyruvate isomerase
MKLEPKLSRRFALAAAAGSAGALLAGAAGAVEQKPDPPLKGRIKQSVARWCFGAVPLDTLCERAKAMGILGIDLLRENEWETAKHHGLICPMPYGIGTIPDGWNRTENHDRLVAEAELAIPRVARAGFPNVITFSGNRRGLSDEQGIKSCAEGLKRIARLAEREKVTVCMELLNSKHDHKDYQCDHTPWGVEVCKAVGSERVKLLFDIYHMQIMEGDVCTTIRDNIAYIAHFHTGGVPGRREIDETQELNYGRVCQEIARAGFQGYVAQEFLPSRDPMASLQQAVRICDA